MGGPATAKKPTKPPLLDKGDWLQFIGDMQRDMPRMRKERVYRGSKHPDLPYLATMLGHTLTEHMRLHGSQAYRGYDSYTNLVTRFVQRQADNIRKHEGLDRAWHKVMLWLEVESKSPTAAKIRKQVRTGKAPVCWSNSGDAFTEIMEREKKVTAKVVEQRRADAEAAKAKAEAKRQRAKSKAASQQATVIEVTAVTETSFEDSIAAGEVERAAKEAAVRELTGEVIANTHQTEELCDAVHGGDDE